MKYDVTVIGSGPGGYVAAIRAAQLGMKVALVERYPALGGTCLNVGCIPSKALLDSSELYYTAKKHFAAHGIKVSGLDVDWPAMLRRKDKVVADTVAGVAFLMKKNGIAVYEGHGSFADAHAIAVTRSDGREERFETRNTIIATGSRPAALPFAPFDNKYLISSTEALALEKIPEQMIVIGGGAIGLELGSVYARLGTRVSVVEFMDSIIPNMDHTMGKELQKSLQRLGMTFYLSHKVQSAVAEDGRVVVTAENPAGEKVQFNGDVCLISVGRKPYTENLRLDRAGIITDSRGFIEVNGNLETQCPGVFAIGDVIGGAMLAHKAEEEGIFVAERLSGQKPHINYNAIPWVVYTWPEVAGVGVTENNLRRRGQAYKTGMFSYKPLGRARAANESEGLVKVLADEKTDELLGVHMFGARVADMIAEAVVALEYRASAEDIARMSHAHPTFTEAFREACLAATGNRAIHA
ncbi:dihydrolipoyl dehydrogenase [candidate division KSB1 bacterium]|nr:MAG: dihydrolipoyl dehydrogenase [candidate division KSB1 bacterium]